MNFEILNQRLLNADWREFLPSLPDASVDLLLTDPPYGTTNIVWDKKIDWSAFWAEAKRVCKENAVMIIFAAGQFVPEIINSNPKEYRYELIWEKNRPTGHLDARRRPMRAHEQMLIFTKKGFRSSIYNPQMVEGKPHKWGGNKTEPVHYHGANRPTPLVVTNLYYPRSIWKYGSTINGKSLHPTAKPLELMRDLVLTYSNAGETVLDPFFGSGTTLAASMIANRRGIGCEISANYFETAKARLIELEAAL